MVKCRDSLVEMVRKPSIAATFRPAPAYFVSRIAKNRAESVVNGYLTGIPFCHFVDAGL